MKLKKILGFAAISLAAVSFAACSPDDLDTYAGGPDGIFIQEVKSWDIYGNVMTYQDYKEASFAGSESQEHNFTMVVRLQGYPAKKDRKYEFKVVPDSCTCEMEDISLDRNDFIIQAGCAADTVIVTVKRSDKLRGRNLKAYFRIEANENFRIAIDSFKSTATWSQAGEMMKADAFYFNFGEIYTEPNYYRSFGRTYFGTFTAEKYIALNDCMGYTQRDWNYGGSTGSKVQYGRMDFAARAFKNYLQEAADAGNPFREADGSLMQLPSPYQVDYSAYETPIN